MWRLEDSTPRQISAHNHYVLMENKDFTVPSKILAQFALLNDDMLGYGKKLGRGLGRELAQLRKINVMSDWRQTTNQAMDGRATWPRCSSLFSDDGHGDKGQGRARVPPRQRGSLRAMRATDRRRT